MGSTIMHLIVWGLLGFAIFAAFQRYNARKAAVK